MKSKPLPSHFLLVALLSGCLFSASQQGLRAQSSTGWTGNSDGFWSNSGNWTNGIPNSGSPAARILNFGTNGNAHPNSTNDLNNVSTHQIIFLAGATNYTLYLKTGTGGTSLNDFSGVQPQMENDSTNLQTIDMAFKMSAKSISGAANQFAKINPSLGDLLFTTNSSITLITNTQLKFFSTAGRTNFFNCPILGGESNACVLATTGAGGFGPTVIFANTNSCTNTYIACGTVRLATNNATGSTQTITLGDTAAANAPPAFLLLDNGLANSSILVIQPTQPTPTNSKTIGNSTFGSGQATYTGPVSLGTNVTLMANPAGTLVFTGNFDFQNPAGGTSNRTITVAGSGNTIISGNLTNAATGISVVTKTNAGTLTLGGSNANRILYNLGGGIVSITSSNAIGVPTNSFPDKVNFTANATLSVSNSFTLGSNVSTNNNAGFRINGGSTGTFDVASNSTLTVDGVIIDIPASGAGNLTKAGAGTLVLNQTNTYSGTTTVSAGALKVNNVAGSATGSGPVMVDSGAVLTGPGSVSGAVTLDGTISPGSSPGTITTGAETWDNGGHYSWDINAAAGTSGADPGQDLITVNGALNVAATAGGFTIDINGLTSGNVPGAVPGFSNTARVSWIILHATGGISGFDSSSFTLNAANFSNNNPPGLGVFQISVTNSGNDLALSFIGNTAPVAGTGNYSRPRDISFKIKITDLLTNASDPDGDAISLLSVGSLSTNGAAISNDLDFVYYNPPATNGNVTDSFTYTVVDALGATNQGTVVVTIQADTNSQSVNIVGITSLGDGTKQIDFAGIPNRTYLIQATTNLTPAIIWTTIGTNQAGTNGLFQFIDLDAASFSNRFYRTANP